MWPRNKEMESFTHGGGHLGRHLEYLKFLNDASWASSRFYAPPSTKISKNLLGGIFYKVDLSRCWTTVRNIYNMYTYPSAYTTYHIKKFLFINVMI